MRSIFTLDDAQLRQIETKLRELAALPAAEQARRQCLVEALHRERSELLRYRPRSRRERKLAA